MNEIQVFNLQTTDDTSEVYKFTNEITNIITEGTWDGAEIDMQIKHSNSSTWVNLLNFTDNDFAIITNILPTFSYRFVLSSAGASTSLNLNMILA